MTDAREEIEKLVRRVLAELLANPSSPTAPAKATTNNQTTSKGALQFDERVISVRLLEGRLEGIQQIEVPRGAVVTPAARDELKRRGIALQSAASGGNGKGASPLVLAATGAIDPQAHVAALGDACAVEVVSANDLAATVGRWADRVLGRKTPGVIVTEDPAAVLCLANRNFGIRAIHCTSPREVAEGAAAIGANGLVVDPRGRGRFELVSIVRAFAKSGWRNPPDALRRALSGT